MQRPSVLLAEDHVKTAEQLKTLLQPHFEVVAVVGDGIALVSVAARLSPDVIVTDISMPGLDGIEATALILRADPEARVVLVTVHSEPMLVMGGMAAGAMGYVLKDAAGDDLVAAVHAVLGGERYVSQALRDQELKAKPP
jgi:DNA-binding NarL/FixJ family response regulator